MIRVMGCFVIAAMASPAFGLGACPTPDLLKQPARAFGDLYQSMNQAPKGEFESTAAYEARRSATAAPGQTLIELKLRPDGLKYNADQQAFEYLEFAFQALSPSPALISSMPSEARSQFNSDDMHPVSLTVSVDSKEEGTYEGQNAYGATTTVTKMKITEQLVFDRPGRKGIVGDSLLAEYKDFVPQRFVSIPASIDQAPALKGELRAVALVTPRAPFVTAGIEDLGPTRTTPLDRVVNTTIIFADIQCVGVLDGKGNVLASWVTR